MANLAALASATTAITALAGAILVTPDASQSLDPQKQNTELTAPDKFIFDTIGEQSGVFESDIPVHFVEDNQPVSDMISLKPISYVVKGFISELNDIPPFPLKILKSVADNLTSIGAYAPQLSATALIAYQEAFFLYQTAAGALSTIGTTISTLTGGAPQNAQQQAFTKIYQYWLERRLFTVNTPWIALPNMAITRLRVIQDEETTVISDFEVTFQQIRFASTEDGTSLGLDSSTSSFQGQAASQASGLENLGTSQPPDTGANQSALLAQATA